MADNTNGANGQRRRTGGTHARTNANAQQGTAQQRQAQQHTVRQSSASSQQRTTQQQRVAQQRVAQQQRATQQQRVAQQRQAQQTYDDVNAMSADEFYGAPVRQQPAAYATRSASQQAYTGDYGVRGIYDDEAPEDVAVKRVKHSGKRRRRRRNKRIGIAIAVVVVVLILAAGACGGMLYMQAQDMKADAKTIMAKVSDISTDITSNDYAAASSAAQELKQMSSSMNDTLSSPLWTVASRLPVIGDDITAVRTLGSVLDSVADDALVPLTQSLQTNPPSSLLSDGAINVQALNTLVASVQQAAPALDTATKKLDTLPETHIDQLTSMVDSASEKLKSINDAFQTLDQLAPILSDALGANGERRYLIVAQNTAELRASGGFNGAYATMTINNGKIELGEFGTANYIGDDIPESLTTTATERELFSEQYMTSARNMNYDPDFVRDAEIWAAAYPQTQEGTVDGVISVVPSVVQDLLAITGGITLSDGTQLDGTNATKVLEHDIYWKYLNTSGTAASYGNDTADALFGEAAHLAFNKLFDNLSSSTLVKLGSVMVEDATTRKIMIWMANADEEQRIKDAGMSGGLNSDATAPELGVYASTGMAGKLGWYIDLETTIGEAKTNADGTTSYYCTTTIHNAATDADVLNGSAYIMGVVEKGEPWPWLHIFAPAGGTISNFTVVQGDYQFKESSYEGLQVMYLSANDGARLPQGATISCSYTVTVSASATEPLALSTTPTLTEYR